MRRVDGKKKVLGEKLFSFFCDIFFFYVFIYISASCENELWSYISTCGQRIKLINDPRKVIIMWLIVSNCYQQLNSFSNWFQRHFLFKWMRFGLCDRLLLIIEQCLYLTVSLWLWVSFIKCSVIMASVACERLTCNCRTLPSDGEFPENCFISWVFLSIPVVRTESSSRESGL